MHQYTYLALGDSYTIGESVLIQKNFPYQVVQRLRKEGYQCAPPEIIARTGWTTGELEAAMKDHRFMEKYDWVTLLIGVNNQYRGLDVIEYKTQFEELLKKALELAGGKKDHVILVSIPDYSVTPYSQAMDKEKIARDIDVFNGVSKALSIQYKLQYVDITSLSREAASDESLIAQDGLHPSAIEYEKWAKEIAAVMLKQMNHK
ncbi:MAG TPA: SGNH/GDSL hydrolase family protein [Ferruginibacter sp.]|nr:SGNH/GDSL hydrolase family protein [Ferruginibacter sp.]